MNTMQAKTELREYRKINELIVSKQIILSNLHIRLANLKAMNSDKEDIIRKIKNASEEHEKRSIELEKLVHRSEELRRTIDGKFEKMNELHSKILRMKYYRGMTLLLISTLLNYEYTWLCKLHARALKEYSSL